MSPINFSPLTVVIRSVLFILITEALCSGPELEQELKTYLLK